MPGLEGVKGGGWNGTLEILYGGGGGLHPHPTIQPSTLLYTIFTEKLPLSHTFG